MMRQPPAAHRSDTLRSAQGGNTNPANSLPGTGTGPSSSQRRFRIVGETGDEYEAIPLHANDVSKLAASAFPLAAIGSSSALPFASVVGEGTFGTVYCGRSTTTGRIVALKRIVIANPSEGIPPLLLREISLLKKLESMRIVDLDSTGASNRCQNSVLNGRKPAALEHEFSAVDNDQLAWCREMRQRQAARRHPNIVQLCDIALVNHPAFHVLKDIYLVFEYLDCDLHKLIHEQKQRRIDDGDCRHIMHQALNGVSFLHDNLIMHRDLKPANILVSSDTLHVKIADFGLSRELNFNQPLTETVVTIWYRPPEVLLHTSYTYAVDVWSLGCILYELVERRVLFKARTDLEQLQVITNSIGMPERDKWPESGNMLWNQLVIPPTGTKKRTPFSVMLSSFRRDTADLLRSMLQFFPGDRITIDEALRSAFLLNSKLKSRRAVPLSRVCSDNINRCCAEKRKVNSNPSQSGADTGLGVKRFRSADDEPSTSNASCKFGCSTANLERQISVENSIAVDSHDAGKCAKEQVRRYELRAKVSSLRRQLSEGGI